MKEYMKKERTQKQESEKARRFRRDVQQAASEKQVSSRKSQSRPSMNRAIVDEVKLSAALHRAAASPLVPSILNAHDDFPTRSTMLELENDELSPFPMLSRIDGEEME